MLSNLKFSEVVKGVGGNVDQTTRLRAKLVAAVSEQRQACEAAIERKPFTATRRGKGGAQIERKFRPWWFRSAGFFYTSINYGSSALVLNGSKAKSIECGPRIEDVLTTYDHVTAAINAGELDDVLLAASGKRGRKRNAPPAPAAAPEKPADAPSKPAQGAAVSGSAKARNRG